MSQRRLGILSVWSDCVFSKYRAGPSLQGGRVCARKIKKEKKEKGIGRGGRHSMKAGRKEKTLGKY